MPNVNKVTVMGVLGRDPETKQFPNGGSVTTFSVATTEFWKDKTTGERKEATEWHRITTNNRLAEISKGRISNVTLLDSKSKRENLDIQHTFDLL